MLVRLRACLRARLVVVVFVVVVVVLLHSGALCLRAYALVLVGLVLVCARVVVLVFVCVVVCVIVRVCVFACVSTCLRCVFVCVRARRLALFCFMLFFCCVGGMCVVSSVLVCVVIL